jgi:cysteinyl-tRNA synthetase
MHNNFLVDRTGKLSKSTGGALLLQDLIDRGYHPMAFRLLCLQAHYRSPLEFSFTALKGALSRLKRIVIAVEQLRRDVQGALPATPAEDGILERFRGEIGDDLMTPRAIPILEDALARDDIPAPTRLSTVRRMDDALGLQLSELCRLDLRIRPIGARLVDAEVEGQLKARQAARASNNFAEANRIRADLEKEGVVVMDGDELQWEWRLDE